MLRLQGSPLQKLVAQTVVESTVETRGTAVRVQDSETFHLVFPIHEQFRFVAINSDQNHILHDRTHVAPQKLIGYAICEELQRQNRRRSGGTGESDI